MVIRLERVPAPTVAGTATSGTEAEGVRGSGTDTGTTAGGRRRRRVALVTALVAILVACGASLTAWALIAPAGAVGHDVSYPQCGTALPSSGTFGIVGVNGGKVSTANPCLSTQYAWASRTSSGAALYANTGNPGSISTFYWPASGSRDPALCKDRTSASDPGCAYDYGWHGGKNSLQIAQNALSGASGRTWWLDVELANSWNGSTSANAAALQGAVDALHDSGVGTVGIYSTAYQWGQITGGYASGNAASYRSAWAASFTPKHPMEQAPLWIAGLSTLDAASRNCATTFTGGTAALAQYTDGNTDGDLVCGASPVTTPPTTDHPVVDHPVLDHHHGPDDHHGPVDDQHRTDLHHGRADHHHHHRAHHHHHRAHHDHRAHHHQRPGRPAHDRPRDPHRGRRQRLGRAQLDRARRRRARVDLQRAALRPHRADVRRRRAGPDDHDVDRPHRRQQPDLHLPRRRGRGRRHRTGLGAGDRDPVGRAGGADPGHRGHRPRGRGGPRLDGTRRDRREPGQPVRDHAGHGPRPGGRARHPGLPDRHVQLARRVDRAGNRVLLPDRGTQRRERDGTAIAGGRCARPLASPHASAPLPAPTRGENDEHR